METKGFICCGVCCFERCHKILRTAGHGAGVSAKTVFAQRGSEVGFEKSGHRTVFLEFAGF